MARFALKGGESGGMKSRGSSSHHRSRRRGAGISASTAGLLYLRVEIRLNATAGLLEDKPLPVTLWSFKSACG